MLMIGPVLKKLRSSTLCFQELQVAEKHHALHAEQDRRGGARDRALRAHEDGVTVAHVQIWLHL
eukprot:14332556-Alexandrium_andersonii.AAC.1